MTRKATPELFVAEYLRDLNATQAYIRAGYSERGARQCASRMMARADVQALVATGMNELRKQANLRISYAEVSAERVITEFAAIAFADIGDIADFGTKEVAIGFDADGHRLPPDQISDAVMVRYAEEPYVAIKDLKTLPKHVRAAIAEVSVGKYGLKIKLHDKPQALLQLGRHLNLFADDNEAAAAKLNALFVDRPPPESREEWLARKRRELADAVEGVARVVEDKAA